MPSPRRNGKRGKDKPVTIIFPNSPIGYLGGMPLSGGDERCLKFANEKEARAWVLNQQMMVDRYDAHLYIDILKHIDKGEKVIRCKSYLTYGPHSIWTGYDYGIDLGPAGLTTITRRQGAESASASESAISSAHAGSRNIYDDMAHSIDSIYSQHLARYEQSSVTPQSGVAIDRDQSSVTIDRALHERIQREISGAIPRPSDLFESIEISPSAPDREPAVAIEQSLSGVLDGFRASQMASESASNAAVDAATEERNRQAQRYIEEFLAQGHGPMSRYEDRYEDGAGTCSTPG